MTVQPRRRRPGSVGVRGDVAAAHPDSHYGRTTRIPESRVGCTLPSEAFCTGAFTLTLTEWRRGHLATYGAS